ncbi:MAG TPA: nucleoside deaminase [Victivallales bacterium]|nr:nucleoside deaminase [Victivallales bacterium]
MHEKQYYEKYIKRTIELSMEAIDNGNNPFGAILIDKNGEVLLEQENIERTTKDCTGHAETALMRSASKKYSKDFLWNCTLITVAEPCAMCSGAIYWGNVGKVVYGLKESTLLKLTGNNPLNPTMSLNCETVFKAGQKNIEILGPMMEEEIIISVKKYWNSLIK